MMGRVETEVMLYKSNIQSTFIAQIVEAPTSYADSNPPEADVISSQLKIIQIQ